jgi:predicted  nucleic acid-binding Zn ribbon protein
VSSEKNSGGVIKCPKCGGETIAREGQDSFSFECRVCRFVRIVRVGSDDESITGKDAD